MPAGLCIVYANSISNQRSETHSVQTFVNEVSWNACTKDARGGLEMLNGNALPSSSSVVQGKQL